MDIKEIKEDFADRLLNNGQILWLISDCEELKEALSFYANPGTYIAIGFLPYPPCGDFMNDFSETDLGVRPGKIARKALEGGNQCIKQRVKECW